MSWYDWRLGKRVLEVISDIEEKPVAIMQHNPNGTYEVAVRRNGHVMWSTVCEQDFVKDSE
jgi:hypothetical protein